MKFKKPNKGLSMPRCRNVQKCLCSRAECVSFPLACSRRRECRLHTVLLMFLHIFPKSYVPPVLNLFKVSVKHPICLQEWYKIWGAVFSLFVKIKKMKNKIAARTSNDARTVCIWPLKSLSTANQSALKPPTQSCRSLLDAHRTMHVQHTDYF